MRKIFLLGLLSILSITRINAQNVTYSTLFNATTFNRTLDETLPVGSTAGVGDVSANGAATYSIPIVAPSGTNGIVPSVAINYNSQSGNGILGIGWGISGLSVIARQAQTIYHEGETAPIELKSTDRFALDGAKLFFKSGITSVYGADGSVHGIENENFVSVISRGSTSGTGPQWFEAQTLDGIVMEFGKTTNSTIVQSAGGTVLAWGVTKIKYQDGNYIEFVYANDPQTLRIAEINYTGNSVTNLAPFNKIKFEYKAGRIDSNNQYEYGIVLSDQHLLDKVTVTAQTATVKTYKFSYGNDGINSFLTTITESGSDGTSLNSTIFKYGDKPNEFTTSSSSVVQNVEGDEYVGDFNADGLSDVLGTTKVEVNNIPYHINFTVYSKDPTASGDNLTAAGYKVLPANTTIYQNKNIPESTNFLAHDFNGDGTDDVLTARTTTQGGEWKMHYIKVYTSFRNPNITAANPYKILFDSTEIALGSSKINASGNFIFTGDFDGDEIQDIITLLGRNDTGVFGATLHSAISNSVFFGTVTTTGTVALSVSEWASAQQVHVLDFNGDGKSDLMLVKDGRCEIFTFDKAASGWPVARSIFSSTNVVNGNSIIYFGDFNGDRKTDMLVRASISDNNDPWKKYLSTGRNVVEQNFTFDHKPNILGGQSDDQLAIGDFNGDGKSDVYHGWRVTSTNANLDIYYSQGVNSQFIRTPFSGTLGNTQAIASDLNGDGRSDIINRKSYTDPFDIFYFRKEGKENLLEKIANGTGHITEWSYKKLTDAGTFYSQGSLTQNPVNNIQAPIYATYEFKSQNGIGGYSTIQYNYEQAKIHRSGKGFLGFKKVTANNLAMGIKTVSENEFNPTYFDASPYQVSTYLTSNTSLIKQTTFVNEFVKLTANPDYNRRFWFRAKSVAENDAIAGTTVTTTYDYETLSFPVYHGFPVGITVNNNGVETTVTNTTIQGIIATPTIYKPGLETVTNTRAGQVPYTVKTKYSYNSIGQLKAKTDFEGTADSIATSYEYSLLGNIKKTTTRPYGNNVPAAQSVSAVYDSTGRYVTEGTNVLEQTFKATYDPKWGKPLSTTSVDGLTVTMEYDAFGRTKKTTYPEGFSMNQSYGWDQTNGAIWFSLVDHPGKPNVKTWYDLLGREIKTETEGFGGMITQLRSYDAKGNVLTESLPYKTGETVLTTTNTYDEYNRPKTSGNTVLGTSSISYSYGAGTLVTTVTSPANQISSKESDAAERIINSSDHAGVLSYKYNSQGNLTTVNGGNPVITSSGFDAYGNQTSLTDINAGTTSYASNSLGELKRQISANGDTITMDYDLLGRITFRKGPEGTTTYEYYGSGSGASINKVKKVTGFNGSKEEFTYDGFGRRNSVKKTVDNVPHTTTYEYNIYGDITKITYPSGFVTNHAYDANGYPTTIKNNDNSVTLYNNTGMNGLGQNTSYSLGNGKNSTNTYYYGFPKQFLTSEIQNLELDWNYSSRNLNQRKDNIKSKSEDFTYDNLNRLLTATVGGQTAITVNYEASGNIGFKTDAGNYSYHATRKNAVIGVTNQQSTIPLLQQDITYTGFMQPSKVSENGYELLYTYGADYERIKSVNKLNGNAIDSCYYFDGFEKYISAGSTKYIQYVGSPAGLIAIVVSEGNTHTPYYTYTDHLGSILTVTNSDKVIVAEQSFDAWGRRRNPNTWVPMLPTAATALPNWLLRGYTAHEHLDHFGLINMNGRVYDPVLGRMLSPDNNIQEPGMTQSYNRYSYAMNNPMLNTDPDGEFWHILIGAAIGGSINLGIKIYQGKIHKPLDGFVAFGIGATAGAVTAATGGASASALGLNVASFGGGAVAGSVGAATGGLIQGVGNLAYFKDSYTPKDWAIGVAFGGLIGGAGGGIAALIKGKNFWTGAPRANGGNASPFSLKNSRLLREQGWARTPRGQWSNVSGEDLIFINAELESGTVVNQFGGLGTGDVAGYSNLVARVQARLSLYPNVIDLRTGSRIPLPNSGSVVPKNMRVNWGSNERGAYISEWYKRGYSTPSGGWEKYDIHHIVPRELGGGNDFWNLVPLQKSSHKLFNEFWRSFKIFK